MIIKTLVKRTLNLNIMPIGCVLWMIVLFILATDKTEWRPTIIGAIIVIIAAMIIVFTQKSDINFPDELKKDKDNNDQKQ
ncbi:MULTISPECIES: hypothetical protein [Mediterranea]|uniref:hypothetical protein n=1 Tax=Mediterranea TaxID=1926659 RepID=UPI0020123511|nr:MULTISPECIES: hypothetical protein [Mediterranea]MCL1608095.1 hypothetical protein [Mediterranea sp. ET5]MDM8122958.1 hypothetical protein [Mediterranea massiliensis]MDM8197767.1 hypothetical protein [Mediterranea massiliensis]